MILTGLFAICLELRRRVSKIASGRSANFAGGRINSKFETDNNYSVSLWFRNGLRNDARPVTGYFLSEGTREQGCTGGSCGHWGLTGHSGKLIVFNGNKSNDLLNGKQDLVKGRGIILFC